MNRTERLKRARFERIMFEHDALEKRTLSDLRVIGYNFQTIGEARSFLAHTSPWAGLTDAEINRIVGAV